MNEVIEVASRALHILSVVMLLGSAFYIRFVEKGIERIPAWYVLVPTVGVLATGFYQLWMTLQSGTVDKGWHITFGIKFLFVLHILAISFLQLRNQADESKRKRWMNGIVVSGTLAVILGATLRLLHPR
jgi:hypothetical protein